jgi:hypothetical protein
MYWKPRGYRNQFAPWQPETFEPITRRDPAFSRRIRRDETLAQRKEREAKARKKVRSTLHKSRS